jgi:hypothetical protein
VQLPNTFTLHAMGEHDRFSLHVYKAAKMCMAKNSVLFPANLQIERQVEHEHHIVFIVYWFSEATVKHARREIEYTSTQEVFCHSPSLHVEKIDVNNAWNEHASALNGTTMQLKCTTQSEAKSYLSPISTPLTAQ